MDEKRNQARNTLIICCDYEGFFFYSGLFNHGDRGGFTACTALNGKDDIHFRCARCAIFVIVVVYFLIQACLTTAAAADSRRARR